MVKRRQFTSEKIILKLREAEVLLGQGKTVREACRSLEIQYRLSSFAACE